MRVQARSARGLAFLEAGGCSPDLLMIHGWAGSHTHFQAQIAHFEADHRVIAPDLRGYGGSAEQDAAECVEDFADDLLALCEERACDEVVAVGHSLGGAIALALAARSPERIRGAVLIDPAIFFPPPSLKRIDALLLDLAGTSAHAAAHRFAERFLFIPEDAEAVRTEIRAGIDGSSPSSLHRGFAAIRRFDAAGSAAQVQCPVLAIDAARPFLVREELRGSCPQVEFQQIETAGHYLMQLAPQPVNRAIQDFVARL